MKYPEFLKQGGRIGFVAPSFGVTTEPYRTAFGHALERFRQQGYETVIGPNCYSECGIGKSNTPQACAAEINDFFLNDRADVILSCGGGETMCEDLPYIDFAGIAQAKPHWYMGYSDNTNLTLTLPTLCDRPAIYGPCASSFGMEPWHPAIHDAYELLCGTKLTVTNYSGWEKESEKTENPLSPYHITEPFSMRLVDPKNAGAEQVHMEGRLLGGCLDCMQLLCGTPYDRVEEFCERYADDGILWFIEACELAPMSIHRVLWQLEQAGWFRHVKGFLIGRPMLIDADGMGYDRFSAVTSVLGHYGVPILMDLDIGHLPPMMPIISGALAEVSATGSQIKLRYQIF